MVIIANKEYLTLKRMNAVLALYGVKLRKVLEWNTNAYGHTYVAVKMSEHMYEWSWETTKLYIPYDMNTNMKRLEYVLANLERLK